ncbi:MAG: hypothetical protein E5X13_05990, partial [Mesorhizobium sp.]
VGGRAFLVALDHFDRLGIGYNRAASLVERMEKEGLVGAPNHVGKREILAGRRDHAPERDETD